MMRKYQNIVCMCVCSIIMYISKNAEGKNWMKSEKRKMLTLETAARHEILE